MSSTVKFNGFSQDDINKVNKKSGGKYCEIVLESLKLKIIQTKIPDVKVFAASRVGLRRVGAETTEMKPPPARSKTTNLKASSAVSVPVSKQKNDVNIKTTTATNANDTTLEEVVDLDESMSTSLEDAIYYKPRSKSRKSEEKVSTTEDIDDDDEKVEEVPLPVVRGISMKDFQSHQKLMEEQNKQKKDLLYKAIEKQ